LALNVKHEIGREKTLNKKRCIKKLIEATLKEKNNHRSSECPSVMYIIIGV
jgi:hypothetical protein